MQTYTLYELNAHVRSMIEDNMCETYWVQGEIMEGRVGYGGHFYGEMVEKSRSTGNIVARARIIIWAREYNIIALRFRRETGQDLKPGIRILAQVRVSFSELYGYSLHVHDIDGSYTMGDMARRRQEILHRLEEDGIIDDNKTLPLPMLLKRIAVVSSATAAGYGDFSRQIQDNELGLAFRLQLFPAVMQGAQVPESISAALTAIADEADRWDAVVIIRGGGATTDLSDYDSYTLAACMAQHPLPIFTGIGHDRDETVPDRVAHTAFKTPTAVAAYIVEHQTKLLQQLRELQQRIPSAAQQHVFCHQQRLSMLQQRIPSAVQQLVLRNQQRLALLQQRIPSAAQQQVRNDKQLLALLQQRIPSMAQLQLERSRHQLDMLQHRLQAMNPEILLARGYSITTTVDGHIITDIASVPVGAQITTHIQGGDIISTVDKVKRRRKRKQ